MPKIPLTVISTSSEDSVSSTDFLAEDFRGTNWSVVNMVSIESFPFSEVSHQPYGTESTFLDSVSPGSANLRTRNSISGAQDMVANVLRGSPHSPRPLFSHGPQPHLHAHPRCTNNTSTNAAAATELSSKSKSGAGSPAISTGKFTTVLQTSKQTSDPAVTVAIPGAPSMPRRGQREKPASRRRRSLQAGIPRWQDSEGDTEMLVKREVLKHKPAASTVKKSCEVLSSDSSSSSLLLAPPSLHVGTRSQSKSDSAKTEALSSGEPSQLAETTTPSRAAVAAPASNFSLKSTETPKTKLVQSVNAMQLPMPMKRLSSPRNSAAALLVSSAQSPSPPAAAAHGSTVRAPVPARPSQAPSKVLQHPAAAKKVGPSLAEAAGHPALATSPCIAVVGRKQGGESSVAPSSPSTATSATNQPATMDAAACADGPQSANSNQQRRAGRQRLLSMQSKETDTSETATSSVDTVVVKQNTRHTTLKPLVVSPDEPKRLRLHSLDETRGHDHMRDSFATLSPQQLDSASVDTLLCAERRARSVTPSVDATPTQRSDFSSTPNRLASTRTTSTVRASSSPLLRPQTGDFTKNEDFTWGQSGCISTPNRAGAESLVTFVRAVSDPEVLHVIYDYLVEHQQTMPRYRLAAAACEELLKFKEELLRTQVPEPPSESGGQRGATFRHPTEAETFVIDVNRAGDTNEATSRAAELRHLLEKVAAEQKEREEDPDADEFDDFNFFDTPYPPQGHFSFGQPTVSGVVSRVFAEGMLFKIKTANGQYYFYNDTLHDVMMVRVQCVLRGNEKINERAMLVPVEGTKETEITIAVLPEETNFFMSGVTHLPHFMAKRVPVPLDYVSPSVTQSLRKINAEINAVRKALGKWSRASDQSAFLRCCLQHHLKFTDLTFRPCAESLSRRDCDAVSILPLTWRRPEEYVYLPEVAQTRLFRGEISCFLVKQGELNNHTVVAAMAAIAQFPDHVRWMFRHPVSAAVGKMERAEGCYRVTLLHNGWWKTYVIDDYVLASQKGPLFASCAEDPRRLWVPLLEKAYAKCLGSYAATCVVDAMEAVGDFTGFPVRYLDHLWAAAKSEPTGAPVRTLFSYLQRVVRAGCTVLLFTPAASDAQSRDTVSFSRKRSSRLLPVNGAIPQFLPGRIYFLKDVAFFEELNLRMAQLKNPWTWEAKNNMRREKKWEYTTWYDRPDISMSLVGSVSGSFGLPATGSSVRPQAAAAAAEAEMTNEERLRNDRRGTMWVEWGEVLAAFAGGGVCYTLWNYHRYRTKNAFVNGRPRFVLEMKARRKVEMFVTLSLETVRETLDNYGTVVASRPTPLYGTAISVVQRLSKQSAQVVSESCEDVECMAARRTYVVAKDVSMKLTIDPRLREGTVLVVPLLDQQAADAMAAAASTKSGGANSSNGVPNSQLQSEVHFVLSVVCNAVAGDGEDLSISFVSMRRSCGVFTDSKAPFVLESTSRVTSSYQICTERGVKTLEGNRICDTEFSKRSS
ncbi:putative calpain-like protein putative cysteine peptidase Clan CA family C2 [Leptomonas seymouri]|uniref:Putative calpain-like protein putative cysteine peptidase Clan CA family C2 n=1 Tax=Leptomonas seymouri TaxID=5684 RepID=A0A0N1I1W0_LEPSE|nr:putative calpain-like protein putative cysteine peptidase Clan CA family C2 [Leptomonas seymouri]|eukprot:KPI90323.1 putative calpain-like protein putative cysteine peptidase Clan CA family C2 [Leptomonas seymouri]